ncbi:hypothetical protein HYT01_03675 [Candidatus Giovannonibacteria bacterium]|nr:hypothetical protein [Candidatus Giovannonibacteria bacterium]
MNALWNVLIGTLTALVNFGVLILGVAFYTAEGLYERVRDRGPTWLTNAAIGASIWLVLIMFLVLFKVVNFMWLGDLWVYLAAFLGTVVLVAIGFFGYPIAKFIDLVHRVPVGSQSIGERWVRIIGGTLFAELMIAMYVLFVPFHQNVRAVPIVLISGMAVMIGYSMWRTFNPAPYLYMAMAVFLLTTLHFFLLAYLPETTAVVAAKAGGIDGGLSSVIKNGVPSEFLLLGLAILCLVGIAWLLPGLGKALGGVAKLALAAIIIVGALYIIGNMTPGGHTRERPADMSPRGPVTLKPGEAGRFVFGNQGVVFTNGTGLLESEAPTRWKGAVAWEHAINVPEYWRETHGDVICFVPEAGQYPAAYRLTGGKHGLSFRPRTSGDPVCKLS